MDEFQCNKCEVHGLSFCRTYAPAEFIEGDPHSPIWIIWINPAMTTDWKDGRSTQALRDEFAQLARERSYFRDFRTASAWLFEGMGKPAGVAHTDIVKCSTLSWPPKKLSAKAASAVIAECSQYLREQLRAFGPKMLICNGSAVCQFIMDLIPRPGSDREATSYVGSLYGLQITVVLSGFIGRIDNHAKRRLGREIEEHARRLGLQHEPIDRPDLREGGGV